MTVHDNKLEVEQISYLFTRKLEKIIARVIWI